MKLSHPQVTDGCHAALELLDRVGDRWAVGIMHRLAKRTMRFNELRRALPGVSQKMLTATLRGLERDGFVARHVFPTVPPRVDYKLTELGRDLWTPVATLSEWAKTNRPRVQAARAAFDRQRSNPAVDVC